MGWPAQKMLERRQKSFVRFLNEKPMPKVSDIDGLMLIVSIALVVIGLVLAFI